MDKNESTSNRREHNGMKTTIEEELGGAFAARAASLPPDKSDSALKELEPEDRASLG